MRRQTSTTEPFFHTLYQDGGGVDRGAAPGKTLDLAIVPESKLGSRAQRADDGGRERAAGFFPSGVVAALILAKIPGVSGGAEPWWDTRTGTGARCHRDSGSATHPGAPSSNSSRKSECSLIGADRCDWQVVGVEFFHTPTRTGAGQREVFGPNEVVVDLPRLPAHIGPRSRWHAGRAGSSFLWSGVNSDSSER